MMQTGNPRQKGNAAIAVEALRDLIFSGALPAGSQHLESELALRLGMSRTPIREAGLMLQAQGLVEVRARKGIRILPISVTDMAEIYDVLTALESAAAAIAASRALCDQELAPLAEIIAEMDRALSAENREAWAKADDLFHAELVRLGGNSRIISIVALMADQVRRAKSVTLFMRPLPLKSNKDHSDLLDAIRAQDPVRAQAIHEAHRKNAKDTLIALLAQNKLHQL
jgi:DNA-binding GntR family transcriptional regulator